MQKTVYLIKETLSNGNTYYYSRRGQDWLDGIYIHDYFESLKEAKESLQQITPKYLGGYSKPTIIKVVCKSIEITVDNLFDSIDSLLKDIKEMLDMTDCY